MGDSLTRRLRALLAALLIAEGLLTGLRSITFLPTLVVYGWPTLLVMALRFGVGALQLVTGSLIIRREPAGERLARTALLASATLTTLELGARLAPSNLVSTYRWPAVALYWIYTLLWLLYLRR